MKEQAEEASSPNERERESQNTGLISEAGSDPQGSSLLYNMAFKLSWIFRKDFEENSTTEMKSDLDS